MLNMQRTNSANQKRAVHYTDTSECPGTLRNKMPTHMNPHACLVLFIFVQLFCVFTDDNTLLRAPERCFCSGPYDSIQCQKQCTIPQHYSISSRQESIAQLLLVSQPCPPQVIWGSSVFCYTPAMEYPSHSNDLPS